MSVLSPAGRRLLLVSLFATAFAFVEAAVVVYLRALYYPGGFSLPLQPASIGHLGVELAREAATLVMLAAVGFLAGNRRWERLGFFMVAFGVWDLFYYVWLRTVLGWPASLTDWDVLFLIPIPWLAPVAAPASVALLMTVTGWLLVRRIEAGRHFHPRAVSWVAGVAGAAVLLLSFMADTGASLRGEPPAPYHYGYLAAALALLTASYVLACLGRPPARP